MNYGGPVPAPHHFTFAHSVAEGGRFVFLLFIFVLPFHRAIFLRENLFGIQGLKPFNVLGAVALAYLIFQSAPLHATDKIELRSIRIFLLYFATFAIALIRSIPNAPIFHARFPEYFPDSYLDYMLSYCMVPAFYTLPFLFALKRMCSFEELERIVTVVSFSISSLSVALIAIVLANPSALVSVSQNEIANLAGESRGELNDLCSAYFGLHYNTIGTLYICTAPLLLYRVLTRGSVWIVPLTLTLAAVLLLQSRSALVSVAVSYCLLLIQRRRLGILMIGAAMVGIVALFWTGSTINSLLSVGFGRSSEISADAVLTGRLDSIWVPLINEWTRDIGLFLFGAGRAGMITSQLWYTGVLIEATHPHNAIIGFFLDCGAIAAGVLLVFIYVGVSTAWRVGRRLNHDLYWASFAGVFGYGISMLTERDVFPAVDNVYVFLLIAMMINLARLFLRSRQPSA